MSSIRKMRRSGVVVQTESYRPAQYHLMSAAEKRAASTASVRERSVACQRCDTQVMPEDLPSHAQRCAGPGEPGPRDKWVSARDAIVRNVPKGTRSYWVKRGFVRVRGERIDQEYLLRDLAKRIAIRQSFRRR